MSAHGFRQASIAKLNEPGLGDKVHKATLHTTHGRDRLVESMPDWDSLRHRAREARLRALDHHDAKPISES